MRLTTKARFIKIVKRAMGIGSPSGPVGPQLLPQTPAVVFNQALAATQDVAGRAVVLLEADGLRAGKSVKALIYSPHRRRASR